jgi:hypothetical protein
VPIYPEADEIAAAERHVPVEAGVLRHVADCRVTSPRRLAEDIERTAGQRSKAEERAQQRGLARSVGPQDRHE